MNLEPLLFSALDISTDYGSIRGHRVLIVDDNRDGADSLAELFTLWGAVPHVRYNGATAVEAAAVLVFDVAILDLAMPEMDGGDAAARIRASQAPPPLMIALTGLVGDTVQERVSQGRFDLHFAKPVHARQLLAAIRAWDRAPPHGNTG